MNCVRSLNTTVVVWKRSGNTVELRISKQISGFTLQGLETRGCWLEKEWQLDISMKNNLTKTKLLARLQGKYQKAVTALIEIKRIKSFPTFAWSTVTASSYDWNHTLFSTTTNCADHKRLSLQNLSSFNKNDVYWSIDFATCFNE